MSEPLQVSELPVLMKWLEGRGDHRHGIIRQAVEEFQRERWAARIERKGNEALSR